MYIHADSIILSGGSSKRMKCPKLLLKTKNGKTFLENLIFGYLKNNINTIVVLNEKLLNNEKVKYIINSINKQNIEFVINKESHLGRFYSILTGIAKINENKNVFIHNIDNPYVNSDLLLALYKNLESNSYVVPIYNNKGGHPILLDKKIVYDLKNTLSYNLNFKDFLMKYKRISISYDKEDILLNINSPDDYNKYINNPLISIYG